MADSTRVTLSDIAERLDLTKVSISKALRDHPDISAQTKERVRAAAKEMGYTPNRLARSLRTNQTGTIGVVIPKIAHNFFADALGGINEVASANGYEIILCVSEESKERERRHLRTLLSMQVDGLLVSISAETESFGIYDQIGDASVPLVFFDRAVDDIPVSRVRVDDERGAYQATEHALQHGHRTIAHLAGHGHVDIGRDRRAGYESALREHGEAIRDEWIVEGGFGEEHGYSGTKTLLDSTGVPDAIFAVTFPVALGVEDALRRDDRVRPEQVQIYSFGQHSLNRFFRHPHVSIHQPARKMGEKALSLLLKEVDNPDREPQDVTLPTRIVEPNEIKPPYLDGVGNRGGSVRPHGSLDDLDI